jgi:flagellar biosynthesis protein FlhF
MRIKRIEADNIADAMRELRRELGDRALILHTRPLPPKGVTGWFKAPRIEILGAVDEPGVFAGAQPAVERSADSAPSLEREPQPFVPSRIAGASAPVAASAFARMQRQAASQIQAAGMAPIGDPAPTLAKPGRKSKARRGLAVPAPTDSEQHAGAERLERLRSSHRSSPIPADQEAGASTPRSAEPKPAAAASIPTAVEQLAGIAFGVGEWSRIARRARRIAFVGPTGAGKTTTLAKLAARAQLDHGCRVGLITIDTYRIGAVPQLGAYADILKVPLEVAHTPDDLSHALARLSDRDVVFIDTIGRSPLGDGVDALVPFLATAAGDEVHLVLSATTRSGDSLRAARTFARLIPNRLVVTKIDETDDYEALLTVARATQLPLTWLGVGQEVPDDLDAASPDRIRALLARGVAA